MNVDEVTFFGQESLADMLQRRLENEVWCLSNLQYVPTYLLTLPTLTLLFNNCNSTNNTAIIFIVSSVSQIHTDYVT